MATLTDTSARRDTPGRVVPGPLAWTPPERPHKSWWALVGLPLFGLLIVVWVGIQIRLPYVQLAPGGAAPINALPKVPPQHANPPHGRCLFPTVSLPTPGRPLAPSPIANTTGPRFPKRASFVLIPPYSGF